LRRQADFSRLAKVPALAVAGAHEKEGVTDKNKKRMRTEFRSRQKISAVSVALAEVAVCSLLLRWSMDLSRRKEG
jgi:hypothetical protein